MAFKGTTERNAMNYYISDLHIGHENILRFDNRPFADVNEMNNKLKENWNARVRSDDTVYILGDFIWAKESEWPSIVKYAEPITIGDHCWLCAGATVCGGVTIADIPHYLKSQPDNSKHYTYNKCSHKNEYYRCQHLAYR